MVFLVILQIFAGNVCPLYLLKRLRASILQRHHRIDSLET